MKEILVDKNGYEQFFRKLEELKEDLTRNAAKGSKAYNNAVGDGWHDNFDFEETMRKEREIAFRINSMLKEQQQLKIVERKNFVNENFIDIEDTLKILICYSNDDTEEYNLKLTGKYLPESKNDIQEISLNSPLGKSLYGKNIHKKIFFDINDKKVEIIILEKNGLRNKHIDDII